MRLAWFQALVSSVLELNPGRLDAFMLRRWRQLRTGWQLIFLMLFAVLLPTIVLLVTQFYALLETREKNRVVFENNLRQTLQAVDDNLDRQLAEIGRASLQSFEESSLDPWNAKDVKDRLTAIVSANPHVETAFAISGGRKGFTYTAFADANAGYREIKSASDSAETYFSSPEEESVTVSFVAVIQSPTNSRAEFPFVQSECEKCSATSERKSSARFYIYRLFSNPRDVEELRFVGLSLKRDFVVETMFPTAVKAVENDSAYNPIVEIDFGAFDEHGDLVYSSGAGEGKAAPHYEVQTPLRKSFARWNLGGSYRDNNIEDLSTNYFRANLLVLFLIVSLMILGILLMLGVTSREVDLAAAKSVFVSNVSHELKTPLSLIRLFVELLENERVKPEKRKEYLQIISKETHRLTALINNILDFAAIEAGKKEYKFAVRDLNETVAEVVDNYSVVLSESGFTLQTDFAENLPPVSIDRDAISQAVLNLVNNAIKYSPDEKHISVKTKPGMGGVGAAIEVTDRGAGIPSNEHIKIFEKFYRSGGADDVHNVKGSGLGLSLVKHVADAHGGGVTVKSVVGKGSTFTIWLPAANLRTDVVCKSV